MPVQQGMQGFVCCDRPSSSVKDCHRNLVEQENLHRPVRLTEFPIPNMKSVWSVWYAWPARGRSGGFQDVDFAPLAGRQTVGGFASGAEAVDEGMASQTVSQAGGGTLRFTREKAVLAGRGPRAGWT